MKAFLYCSRFIAVVAVGSCLIDSVSAQDLSKLRNKSNNGSGSFARGSNSSSSSMSFKKDGKKISIEENGSGITVTANGKSVSARNLDELKQQYPEAYQLYIEKPGFAIGSSGGSASGSGSGGSSSMSGEQPGKMEGKSSQSKDRSVSVMENGRKVKIAESASGITVDIDGKSIRVRNVDELKKKSPVAYKLYQKHLKKSVAKQKGTGADGMLRGSFDAKPTAKDLLREKLKEMQNKKAADPRFQSLIQKMLKEMDR